MLLLLLLVFLDAFRFTANGTACAAVFQDIVHPVADAVHGVLCGVCAVTLCDHGGLLVGLQRHPTGGVG